MAKSKKAVPKNDLVQENNNIKERVLQVLENSTWEHITKETLAIKTSLNVREVRSAVSKLRKDGHPICIAKDGSGYWYGTRSEYKATVIRDYYSRIADMVETVNAFHGLPPEGQINWNEIIKGITKGA